jgi:hypothetical protein
LLRKIEETEKKEGIKEQKQQKNDKWNRSSIGKINGIEVSVEEKNK